MPILAMKMNKQVKDCILEHHQCIVSRQVRLCKILVIRTFKMKYEDELYIHVYPVILVHWKNTVWWILLHYNFLFLIFFYFRCPHLIRLKFGWNVVHRHKNVQETGGHYIDLTVHLTYFRKPKGHLKSSKVSDNVILWI